MYYFEIHWDVIGLQCKIGFNITTPKQVAMGDQLYHVGKEEVLVVEEMDMQLHRQIPEP